MQMVRPVNGYLHAQRNQSDACITGIPRFQGPRALSAVILEITRLNSTGPASAATKPFWGPSLETGHREYNAIFDMIMTKIL